MSQAVRRDVFQAIANPTRRGILLLLATGALTPNVMAQKFELTRQAVSKHLQILVQCKLVQQAQTGREVHYHLNTEKIREVDSWLAPFRQMWEDKFHQLDDLLTNI